MNTREHPAVRLLSMLRGHDIDPTVPAVGQLWQARDVRDGGQVCRITHFEFDDLVTHFDALGRHYVLTENLVTCWRCVDSLPDAMVWLNGRLVQSWPEMAIAAQLMLTTSTSSV